MPGFFSEVLGIKTRAFSCDKGSPSATMQRPLALPRLESALGTRWRVQKELYAGRKVNWEKSQTPAPREGI